MFAKFEQFLKIPQILSNYKNISIYDESRLKSKYLYNLIGRFYPRRQFSFCRTVEMALHLLFDR